MEFNVKKLLHNVQWLLSILPPDKNNTKLVYLEKFIKTKECNTEEVKLLMECLSELLLDETFIESIAISFEDCLLLLVSNTFGGNVEDTVNVNNFAEYQRKSLALAKLMHLSNDVKQYALKYFLNKPPPFSSAADLNQSLPNKKSRPLPIKPTSFDIVKCCYRLLKADIDYFKNLWNWSEFVDKHLTEKFFSKKGNLQDVYINHILAFLCGMNSMQLRQLNLRIAVKYLIEFEEHNKLTLKNWSYKESGHDTITLPLQSSFVCNVEGVLLSVFNKENYDYYDNFQDSMVKVDSTKANLRSIALGVANSKAICLSGPVGCGKTTLVEYLARKTGRLTPKIIDVEENDEENTFDEKIDVKELEIIKAGFKRKSLNLSKGTHSQDRISKRSGENGFLRIQLGDQTDCKMLLGQYHCTDVPGEFVWLPGVLTQAVMNGYWLLLEDLDSATQDTYTVLSSLLENKCLSVPGFSDCVKIAPGFQLFVTVRTLKSSSSNTAQKALLSFLEKYLYTINILPLSRNELCKVVASNYPKLSTIANRIVDVFLIFSSGDHSVADNLRQQEANDKADTTDHYLQLPYDEISISSISSSGRMVSTRDLIKLCQRSNPTFSVTSTECAYFVFQNAVDVFCSYIPQSREKAKLITAIGAKLGIIQSRCEHLANEYKPEIKLSKEYIKVGRAELQTRKGVVDIVDDDTSVSERLENQAFKRMKLMNSRAKDLGKADKKTSSTFSFTRLASCMLERIAVCVQQVEPVLLVGETGVGKTSSVQYLAERTKHKLMVVNMNNQSDVSDLIGGFKPVDLSYVVLPLRSEFEFLFRHTFNATKNESFLTKFSICYNQGNFPVIVKLMLKIVNSVFEKAERNELRDKDLKLIPRWRCLKIKLQKLCNQLNKSINISFAFIPGSLVNCIKFGDWVLLDEINLASAETLECLSTILEPDGSVVLLEKGDFTPVKRHPDFRIFACMNPNTDVGKKDLPVGIRNRFTEFYVDEITSEADLRLLVSDYLRATGIQKIQTITNIVKLYIKLKQLAQLELNDGLGNRPVYSLRTLCRSLNICARNLCGSIERNLYESLSLSFLTQLDSNSHNTVLQLIQTRMLSDTKAILKQQIPKPSDSCLNFEGYWIEKGPKELQECSNYILTESVRNNLKDLTRIISIGKFPVLLQGPTSAGKTSLIEYVAKRSGNYCLRINNHEHTDLQEYIGTYTADTTGKLTFKEGVLVQAMRQGYWIILDELNLASTEILEALNRVLDDNRELFIPETQTIVKAHPNFMLFATQNPPGLYGGRKVLSRAFKNRFIELHFSEIPRAELEVILEKRCLIPASYARKMVACMADLQKNRKTTSKNIFTLRDLFRWGNRYTWADKKLLEDPKYDWNQHLIEEGYLVLSSKVRSDLELQIIAEALYNNFKKRIVLSKLFNIDSDLKEESAVTRDIIRELRNYRDRADIVWTRNMTRMAVLTAKALQFNEPVLLVGPTGCGKTTVCQLLAKIHNVKLRILNCHMHTEGADFLGGLRPCRQNDNDANDTASSKLFEWSDGPLIHAMLEGSYFMADEISLAEDSVLERLNCVLELERTVLLAEKGGITTSESTDEKICQEFVIQARDGFQFLATMNPGGDFGKKELSPALRNRFTEIWCQPSDTKEDLIQIANNCMQQHLLTIEEKNEALTMAQYIVEIVLFIRQKVEKFKFSIRDILAWANYIVNNNQLSFGEKAFFGLETIFLDALEMLSFESLKKIDELRSQIINEALNQAAKILKKHVTLEDLLEKKGNHVEYVSHQKFGIKPFFIPVNTLSSVKADEHFLFDAPTTKKNLFRLLSALTLKKPILLEGPPGVGKTSIVESIAQAIGFQIVRINLCEHTDLADLFGTDLPAEDNILYAAKDQESEVVQMGSFVWRDGPLLAALKSKNTWILLDELNLAPQSVLEGLNAILDHRGEVYLPELNKTFILPEQTRIFACQNPLKQGGGRKGLPQSFLNRFTKVYLRKLTSEDLLHVINQRYASSFLDLKQRFIQSISQANNLENCNLFDAYDALKNNQLLTNLDSSDLTLTFDLALKMVRFSELLDRGLLAMEFGYKGGPYEINLRDILRWCDLLIHPQTCYCPQPGKTFVECFDEFLLTVYERMKLVYYQRMRCAADKAFIRNAFAQVFKCDVDHLNSQSEDVALYWTSQKIYLNDIVISRESANKTQSLHSLQGKQFSPLLLTSQREVLKNIIECVHMEKPVLVCGPTDAGKTKVIDVLCTLTNQVCNTDAIDDSVTGSFQQIDLNRHLEEISKQVEQIYLRCVQNSLLNGKDECKKTFTQLLNSWSSYNRTTSTKCNFRDTAISEELSIFRERLKKMQSLIGILFGYNSDNKTALQILCEEEKKVDLLGRYLENANSLNTGGHFEWVDSKIVKSLKYGQHLALEHVNLCSSAVLDRLNPVFEPKGKLLISEKGVNARSESAEVVKKGKNFRAFLTIDPKNGELSRAMRNRCIELSLNRETYDLDDKRMIVYAQGVSDIKAINTVIAIHESIAKLTEINNYSVSHLTKMAFLTAAYHHIGYDLERAIYVSAMEVYVYSANTDLIGYGLVYYQQQLRDIVLRESQKYGSLSKQYQEDYLRYVTLYSEGLSEAEMVNLQILPLKIALQNGPQQYGDTLKEIFGNFAKIHFGDLKYENLLRYLVFMVYQASTFADLEWRYLQLENLFTHHNIVDLQKLSENMYKTVREFKNDFSNLNSELPWNTKLYPRLRDYRYIDLKGVEGKVSNVLSALLMNLILQDIPELPVRKLYQLDVLTYSQAISKSSLIDKFNNTFLQYYSVFLKTFEQSLKTHLKNAHLPTSDLIQLLPALLWFNRILLLSKEQIFVNKELNIDLMHKLLLHFNWLQKRLLKFLLPLICISNPDDSAFMDNLQNLNDYASNIKQPLNMIKKLYTKQIMQFSAFYQEEQVTSFLMAEQMDQLLSVIPMYGSFTAKDILRKFIMQKSSKTEKLRNMFAENISYVELNLKEIELCDKKDQKIPSDLKRQLKDLIGDFNAALDNEKVVAIPNNLRFIEAELLDLARELDQEEMINDMESEIVGPKEIELQTTSLREYFLTKFCLYNAIQEPNQSTDYGQLNHMYCEELSTLDNKLWKLLRIMNAKSYMIYRKIWALICCHLEIVNTFEEMGDMLEYLNGHYRQLNALNRLIVDNIQNLQIKNLALRSSCLQALRNEEDMNSLSHYEGPALINTVCCTLYQSDNQFKIVPLDDLELWKAQLEQIRDLLWLNNAVMSSRFNLALNNYKISRENAKRLLNEINYIRSLSAYSENENSSDFSKGFEILINKLAVILERAGKEVTNSDQHESLQYQSVLYETAIINALIGAIELNVFTYIPLIDPVEKNHLKTLYNQEDIDSLSTLKSCFDFLRIIMKYKRLGKEYYQALEQQLDNLQLKKVKLQEKMAKRSKKSLYSLLVKDAKHYLKTNCDPVILFNLLENIQSCCKDLNDSVAGPKSIDMCFELQHKIDIWLTNSQSFLQHTLKPYSGYYEDFLKPLQCAVEQLSFAFNGLNTILTQLKSGFIEETSKSYTNINNEGQINRILENIAEYPRVHRLLVQENSCPLYRALHKLPEGDKDYFLLLKVKLKEIQSLMHIEGKINQNHYRDLDCAFSIINKVWQKEEVHRRERKAEEESLYINKTKCVEDNPDLKELQELEEIFPTSVNSDFGDYLQENSLEMILKLDKQALKTTQHSTLIKEEDYSFIAKLFMEIYRQYPTFYHQSRYNNACKQTRKFVLMFKESMQVFLRLYQHYRSSLNEWLDEQSFNSLAFSVALQQENLEAFSIDDTSTKSYNFYKDSNIQEIVNCTEILYRIEERVAEQLKLYPEHAALLDIGKIIKRIRQLPSNAPVIRFNTGFQLLRQKVSQWNEVAHKNNNLKEEEVKLAEYVQNWTRLELQFWRNCLQQTYENVESQAYKYWFFIYHLLQEYLENHSISSSLKDMKYCEKRFVQQEAVESSELGEKTKIQLPEVINILRQFLESATYGDFHVRLELMKAFEFYLNHCQEGKQVEERNRLEQLIAGLHNLQIYFQQFLNEIVEWNKSVKGPIEKKLKDLVKIESYNKDLSYFSMRNNVAKVHRNLNKFLKEYKQQLEEKIAPVFQMKESIINKDFNLQNGHSTSETYVRDIDTYLAASNLKENYMTSFDSSSSALLQKLSHLYRKSRKVVKDTLTNHRYSQLLDTLDNVLQQQLEHCNDLRQLSVDRGKERSKQVLEAKQILQRKRKALSDFFKLLTLLGINYKTGLAKLSLIKENDEFENYQIPPFCLETITSDFCTQNLNLSFAKAIFKLKILLSIMLTPLSELGLPNIDRIKGFAVQMFLLVQKQRNSLARGCKELYDFKCQLQNMKSIALIVKTSTMSDENLQFVKYQNTYENLTQSFVHISYVLEQFKLLINCLPSKDISANRLSTNLNNLLTKDSSNFANLKRLSDEILSTSQSTLKEMQEKYSEFLNPNHLNDFIIRHEQVKGLLGNILDQLKISSSDYLPLAKPLLQLRQQIGEMFRPSNINSPSFTENDFENFEQELENIIRSALSSLEKLYKKSCSEDINKASQDIKEQEEEEELNDLEENHLKEHLSEDLLNNWKILNLSELNEKLAHALLLIKSSSFPTKILHVKKLISIIPILEQFQLMANYQFTQQIYTHKLSAKILSIMLSVFVEIGTKGFCTPPDLMRDAEVENKQDGQQQQGEKFGLEDGTGEKDASNKIESEDQLEDAKRPEDRKEEKDNEQSDCKEEKGIDVSEDFDGNMQDLEKPENEDDDSGESETEEDVNKEMGETEAGAEKLDDQIWGDDEEEEEKEQEEHDLNEEEQGKGSKDEKDTHNDLNTENEALPEDTKDQQNQECLDATNEDKRKEKERDITDMKEPEVSEEQDNPYHNELEDPPEAEEMDLGDLNANEENDKDNEADDQLREENPFEIDKMKENMPTKDQEDDEQETGNNENKDVDNENVSSDSEEEAEDGQMQREKIDDQEEEIENKTEEMEEEQPVEESNLQKRAAIEENPEEGHEEEQESQKDDLKENYEQSIDKRSEEDNIQSVPEMENNRTADEVQTPENEKNIKQDQKLDEQQTGEEKDGVGQAETENNDGGHQGIAETNEMTVQEECQNEKQTQEKRKQGCTNEERTLGEAEKNKIKQLKTIEKLDEQKQNDEADDDHNEPPEADEYQHVKEPKNSDKITLDNATEEQSKKSQHVENEKDDHEEDNNSEIIDGLMDIDEDHEENEQNNLQEISPDRLDKKSDKPSKNEKNGEQIETTERMEVEGDIVETLTATRSDETTAHCNQELLQESNSYAEDMTTAELLKIRNMYQQEASVPKSILPINEDCENWHTISNRMAQNARDLCEQLRLILEPTKCTRLKGDYRTGRRINMKKIIPYIASQFRKDKIWLRRTKPAQRDYKITIAIDDSKSMHHNNSKMLTLEAISLVAQALTLLESGRLSVLSFGERPQILLNHTEQFDGAKLVNHLNFSQDKTKIAELLDFIRVIIGEECCTSSDNGIFENLLLILSDGRNIFSEGKTKVKNSIKLARLQRVFLVYIIIDNPENKNSILDIQTMEMLPDKKINIKSYLDDFPFPYYVIVRDLNQLPLVLSEAMRQWFELVNQFN
ncbi:midasin [Glossina fuscipes]|uniref:Midasin n=1 Tax=Glossina fuscipes TaxID=7396 RepID=A0A9C6DU77_9MUSC|nr:midasin [Glossina fuscipes]